MQMLSGIVLVVRQQIGQVAFIQNYDLKLQVSQQGP